MSSAIVDKYIGESARLIREMFNYARDHQPCIIFMDEIDAIGGRRFSEGTSADREIQRTLMELLNQMDGFDSLGQVCASMLAPKNMVTVDLIFSVLGLIGTFSLEMDEVDHKVSSVNGMRKYII